MFRFMRGIFKWSVIGGLGLVGLVALVGMGRVKAAYLSVREHVRSNVDELVDTRVALQEEITKLQKEYPQRIADLRMQLREIDRDLVANRDDTKLGEEVVALCRSDREVLTAKLSAADADADGISTTVIDFRSERLPRSDAFARAARIAETEAQYRERLADLSEEGRMLASERAQIEAELAQTESEFREFQAEVGSMIRDIDSLARKEKLVDLAERRKGDRDDIFSDRASSLGAVKDRIDRRRIELEEKLSGLRSYRSGNEYETRARVRIQNANAEAR